MHAAPIPRTAELRCHLCDSRIWDRVQLREGDVVVASWAKSGTTWTQQIVAQLLWGGDPEVEVAAISPWVDFRVGVEDRLAMLEAQTHRRILKTHLPVEALGIDPGVRHIVLARDGRDAMWSYHNHFATLKAERLAAINDAPGRVGPPLRRPPEDPVAFFRDWLDGDGYPFWPFWSHLRGWWALRDRPDVLLLHFEDLRRDLPGSVRRIADFLGLPVDDERLPAILEHCSFDWMRTHAARVVPGRGVGWEDGGASFLRSGKNGRWRDVLPPDLSAAYEARAYQELGPDLARWLATGTRA